MRCWAVRRLAAGVPAVVLLSATLSWAAPEPARVVLLLKGEGPPRADHLLKAATRAFEISEKEQSAFSQVLKAGKWSTRGPGSWARVPGQEPPVVIRHVPRRYISVNRATWEAVGLSKKAVAALAKHESYLEIQADRVPASEPGYKALLRYVSTLLDARTKALYFPVCGHVVASDARLRTVLRSKTPIEGLGVARLLLPPPETDEELLGRLLEDASRRARSKWKEFKQAYKGRKKLKYSSFSVVASIPGHPVGQEYLVRSLKGSTFEMFYITREFQKKKYHSVTHELKVDEVLDWQFFGRAGSGSWGDFRDDARRVHEEIVFAERWRKRHERSWAEYEAGLEK